jgi:hypothetical protein
MAEALAASPSSPNEQDSKPGRKPNQPRPSTGAVLSEVDAAIYIGMSQAFLRADRVRTRPGGLKQRRKLRKPSIPFVQLGGRAIGYLRSDLDLWLESRRVGGSGRAA